MRKIGIICDISYTVHHLFKSYYSAVVSLFGGVTKVKTTKDLVGIEMLFICDDHFQPHKEIWTFPGFIDYCNVHNIIVVVFTNEKIMNSFFPWNETNLKILNTFKYLHHYTSDADDCKILGTQVNRMSLSRMLDPEIDENLIKKDRMVFIGHAEGRSYAERRNVLAQIKNEIQIDIFEPAIQQWEVYMQLISTYKYVFSPIGNANQFVMRFYEILAVGSIPVHQVRSNTLDYYDKEAAFDDCIFFEDPKTIQFNKKEITNHNMIWMEDNIKLLLQKDNLL
jgi:hypothetical protein